MQDFEQEIGLSQGYLARLFRKDIPIDLDRAVLISQKLGIALSELVSCDIQRQERILELEKELSKLKGA